MDKQRPKIAKGVRVYSLHGYPQIFVIECAPKGCRFLFVEARYLFIISSWTSESHGEPFDFDKACASL